MRLERASDLHHVEDGGALHRRAPSDRVVLRDVGPRRATGTFGDVERLRLGGAVQLVSDLGVPLGGKLVDDLERVGEDSIER